MIRVTSHKLIRISNQPFSASESLRRGLLAFAGQRPRAPAPAPTPLLQTPVPPPPPPPPAPRGVPDTQLSLKDVLEITARQQGFTYIPQQGRTKDGKQVRITVGYCKIREIDYKA